VSTGSRSGPRLGYDHASAWYAERVVTPASALARIPDQLDLQTAAALPIGGVTAVQGLLEDVRLQAGETILVGGAAGGTGALVVQLAHHLGARVIATAGPANLDYARSIGADLVLDHTHGVEATVDAVRAFAPGGVDVLFDGVSPENVVALSEAVRDGGRVATLTFPLPDLRPGLQGFQIVSAATPDASPRSCDWQPQGSCNRSSGTSSASATSRRRTRSSAPGTAAARSSSHRTATCGDRRQPGHRRGGRPGRSDGFEALGLRHVVSRRNRQGVVQTASRHRARRGG
jgi:hypothetical protein